MRRKSRSVQEAYRRQAEICKAFANPIRLRLIDMLSRKERWSSELQAGLGISKANLSQHLSILKSAGIVSTRRIGKRLHRGLSMPGAKPYRGSAAQDDEVARAAPRAVTRPSSLSSCAVRACDPPLAVKLL